MWDSLPAFLDQYHGLMIGLAVLALVLLANLLIYRRNWTSYPTRAAYLAAHPGCDAADGGVVCAKCRQKAASLSVPHAGRLYRCTWCDTELCRADGV